MDPAAILLDFDGVLLESNDLKGEAFCALFPDRPERHAAILSLHRASAAPRDQKIRAICAEVLGEPIDGAGCSRLCDEFAAQVRRRILECPFVDGAVRFLEHFAGRTPLHVVSNTPEEELRWVAGERGLSPFLAGVHGSPVSKREHIARILGELGVVPDRVLFVGDAESDQEAARACGVRFAGRVGPDGGRFARPVELPFADMNQLLALLAGRASR